MKIAKIVTTLLAVAFALLTGTASAAPCVWTLQGVEVSSTQTSVGDVVLVQVTTDKKGSFTAPDGWTTEFVPGDCNGRPRDTCGTWKALRETTKAVTSPANFSVSAGACDGPRTYDVTITTTAAVPEVSGVPWTLDEKNKVQEHVDSPHARVETGIINASLGFLWMPNYSIVTRWNPGVQVGLGVLVIPHLRLGFQGNWMQLGLHVAEELSPTVWQVTATSWQVAFQLTGVITPAKWMAIDLGGGIGVLALSTPDTVIRQLPDGRVETILGQTQVTPVFGPLARIAFYPGSSGFGFGGQAALDITMTRLATTLGTQEGGTNAEQHIKAFPTFGVFAGWRF